MGHERQLAVGSHLRVQLFERAGSAVARIGECLQALSRPPGVVCGERGARPIHLAAHLQHVGEVATPQDKRHTANGADVGGYVVAAQAVATGGSQYQPPALVANVQGYAVNFRIHQIVELPALQAATDAGVELPNLILVVGVVDAEHRQWMRNAGKTINGLAGDPLSWRVGRDTAM